MRKRIADRNRANFLDSGDVDLSDEEIAAKYGIRKASVTSWKAEADRMWYSWFAPTTPRAHTWQELSVSSLHML